MTIRMLRRYTQNAPVAQLPILPNCPNVRAGLGSIPGPWSDAYERPGSPNGKKYDFGWSTRETDITKCADEYCRYIEDVVLTWFSDQAAKTKA